MRIKKYLASNNEAMSFKMLIKQIFVWIYILFPVSYIFVFFHRLFSFRNKQEFKYEVSICMIFKNEAKVLREWIEYHRLIGVDHFYLYNNFSDDDYLSVLKPYIEQDIVTLVEWPVKYGQMLAYNDCYEKNRRETRWLGYIDADEFVNLQQCNNIKDFVKKYQAYPALYLYWRMFGTSGLLNEPKEYLMTEAFTASWPWLCNIGKTFINNSYGNIKIGMHQSVAYIAKFPLFPIDDKKMFKPFFSNIFSDLLGYTPKAYINHYWSRSYEFYQYKDFVRGDADSEDNVKVRVSSGRFELHELNNSARDYSIQRWLVLLKKRML